MRWWDEWLDSSNGTPLSIPAHSCVWRPWKEGRGGRRLLKKNRRTEEKSNTHLSPHFSFKGSLSNRRRALRRRQRCERSQRASITIMPASRIGWYILPILESGIIVFFMFTSSKFIRRNASVLLSVKRHGVISNTHGWLLTPCGQA